MRIAGESFHIYICYYHDRFRLICGGQNVVICDGARIAHHILEPIWPATRYDIADGLIVR
jgi:hypothetical protein